MLILRVLLILAVFGIVGSTVAWIVTRDQRYLLFAWRIAKGSVLITLAVFLLFAAERLIII
jgi:hypothetical protein